MSLRDLQTDQDSEALLYERRFDADMVRIPDA
jgi:hypothetical protein